MQEVLSKFVEILKGNGVTPRSASDSDLTLAADKGFPPELLEFYKTCEPDDCFEGVVRINDIQSAICENEEAIPGVALYPLGYVNCATTYCGDGYFIDTNAAGDSRPVCLFSHDTVGEESSKELIGKNRKVVARDFADFLEKFMDESLDEEPNYVFD